MRYRQNYFGLALICVALSGANGALARPQNPTAIQPDNLLERHLLAVQKGERELPAFFDELVDSEVVVLSKQDVLEQKSPEDISALVLPDEAGEPRMLAVFTSAKLARRVAETYPEYRYGITTEFLWVLAHTAPGLGLAINPGWSLGLSIPSYGVLKMRERYAQRIQDHLK